MSESHTKAGNDEFKSECSHESRESYESSEIVSVDPWDMHAKHLMFLCK